MPEVRQHILDGTFHRTLCPECGIQSVIEREFLFIDFQRNTIFKVKPRAARHLWKEASRELDSDISELPEEISHNENRYCRVVFGLAELREKLIAQDAGLDDRLVELAKVFLLHEHPFLLGKPRLRISLNRVATNSLEFVAFHDHDDGAFAITMPRETFGTLVEREEDMKVWIKKAHKHSNLFALENDHWVNMWRWSPQMTALRDLNDYARTVRKGEKIDMAEPQFQRMLTRIPRGSHLPAWAKRALRDIYEYAQFQNNADIMDKTFEIRFDMGLDDDWGLNSKPDDIDTLWDLLRDLPDANVEGNAFISSLELVGGGGGWYDTRTHEIAIGSGLLWQKDNFEDVVRHEVGHAVQEKRDQTQDLQVTRWLEAEFGWAMMDGSSAGIDRWVGMMGGYGEISESEVRQVRSILRLCLGSGRQWGPPSIPFVAEDHPWRKPGFGPRKAFQQTGARWYENHKGWYRFEGKAFFVNFYYRQFMVVNESALDLVDRMPNNYAAMSSYEFFAELYALFYDLSDPRRNCIPDENVAWLRRSIGDPTPSSGSRPSTEGGRAVSGIAGCVSLEHAAAIVAKCATVAPKEFHRTLREVGFMSGEQRKRFRECIWEEVGAAGCTIRRNQIPNSGSTTLTGVRDAIVARSVGVTEDGV